MKVYTELEFAGVSPELMDILIARLSEAGYDGFLEDGDTLKAYGMEGPLDEVFLGELCQDYGCRYVINKIEEQNWNASWESSFSPVTIDRFVAVRADFHQVVKDVEYEIIITPKMSFGTGHHATTWLMLKTLHDLAQQGSPLEGKDVLDFGTGTGILSILAEKMGAEHILAIDHEVWSIENATENLLRNQCQKIELVLADSIPQGRYFDIVLANINKHILLEHARSVALSVKTGGLLIISGILSEDREDMISAYGLYLKGPITVEERNNWLVMTFLKVGSNVD